jgi:hypothetical protein
MDRVSFLIERTGERLGCMLNPETLRIARRAGLRPRRSLGGALTGRGLSDDPLQATGGGVTELTLDLLFDVSIAGSTLQTNNVRDLTAPFWALAENVEEENGFGGVPAVRFVWGKVWNVPAVVAELAERFDQFTPEGVPQRSWVRMRLLRVPEPDPAPPPGTHSPDRVLQLMEDVEGTGPATLDSASEEASATIVTAAPAAGERLDDLAQRTWGDASLWRLIAAFNQVDDPLHVPAGQVLRLPPLGGGQTP